MTGGGIGRRYGYLVNAGGLFPREDIEYMQGANPCPFFINEFNKIMV